MVKQGFVYVLINPSMRQLKIGRTQQSAEERAKQLYLQAKSSMPSAFTVAYEQEVSDCVLVERIVHDKLKKYRTVQNREFFSIPLKEAIKTIERIIADLEKQQMIQLITPSMNILTPSQWWKNLGFAWQQVFRNHITIVYEISEIEIWNGILGVITHCQNEKLRKKVTDFLLDRRFMQKLYKWYDTLGNEKKIFNSYIPYQPSEDEILQILNLESIDCDNNLNIIDLKPLEKLSNLRCLNIMNTFVSNLIPLFDLKDLEEIYLNYSKVETLREIIHLPNLKKVSCFATEISKQEIENFRSFHPNCELTTGLFSS